MHDQLGGCAHSRNRMAVISILGDRVEQAKIDTILLPELVPHLIQRLLVHDDPFP
jgi:hypothetical protein